MASSAELQALELELIKVVRAESAFRLRLGQAFEAVSRGRHFDLGFSSVAAYALERAERGARWVEAARCLARRLEGLPALRRAVALGEVSWSAAELVARVAHAADERQWIEAAQSHTVRELRELVKLAARREGDSGRADEHRTLQVEVEDHERVA